MLTIRFKKLGEGLIAHRITMSEITMSGHSFRKLALGNLCALLVFSSLVMPATAQDFGTPQPQLVLPPQQEAIPSEQVVPGKPLNELAPSRSAAKPVVNASGVVGATFVALDSRLKQVFRGSAPRSLAELRALEEQQAKVAAVIDQVTVNVQQGSAQGSGVIVSGDGYIFTAAHVAGKPGRHAVVRFSDGTKVDAETLGMDRNNDAGLIKIKTKRSTPWPYATRGKSESLREGQWCIAAGHPGGWQSKRGSVIRVGRILSIKGQDPANTLFTDCTLIGGDSGGPLFTLEGKLIGIHSRIGTDMEDNMHVPIEVFEAGAEKLKKSIAWGVLPGFKPLIGVIGGTESNEAIVDKVIPESPAELAGIEVGDRIRSFDGVAVNTFAELQAAVEQTLPGDTVFVEVTRGDATLRFPLVVGIESD